MIGAKYLLPIRKLKKPGPNRLLAKGMEWSTMHRVKLSIVEVSRYFCLSSKMTGAIAWYKVREPEAHRDNG